MCLFSRGFLMARGKKTLIIPSCTAFSPCVHYYSGNNIKSWKHSGLKKKYQDNKQYGIKREMPSDDAIKSLEGVNVLYDSHQPQARLIGKAKNPRKLKAGEIDPNEPNNSLINHDRVLVDLHIQGNDLISKHHILSKKKLSIGWKDYKYQEDKMSIDVFKADHIAIMKTVRGRTMVTDGNTVLEDGNAVDSLSKELQQLREKYDNLQEEKRQAKIKTLETELKEATELTKSLGTENTELKDNAKKHEAQLNRLGDLEKLEGLFAKYIAPKVYGHVVPQVQDGVEPAEQSVLFAQKLGLKENIDTLYSRWESILNNLPKETRSQKNTDNSKYNFIFGD